MPEPLHHLNDYNQLAGIAFVHRNDCDVACVRALRIWHLPGPMSQGRAPSCQTPLTDLYISARFVNPKDLLIELGQFKSTYLM